MSSRASPFAHPETGPNRSARVHPLQLERDLPQALLRTAASRPGRLDRRAAQARAAEEAHCAFGTHRVRSGHLQIFQQLSVFPGGSWVAYGWLMGGLGLTLSHPHFTKYFNFLGGLGGLGGLFLKPRAKKIYRAGRNSVIIFFVRRLGVSHLSHLSHPLTTLVWWNAGANGVAASSPPASFEATSRTRNQVEAAPNDADRFHRRGNGASD
jgi:hypothetical protein